MSQYSFTLSVVLPTWFVYLIAGSIVIISISQVVQTGLTVYDQYLSRKYSALARVSKKKQ